MDNFEKTLIQCLQDNARYTITQLAALTGSSEEDVKNAVKKLEDEKVIVKYSAIVNQEKVDENIVQAMIDVKVTPQKLKGFDAMAEEICRFEEVESVYLMSGGFDLSVCLKGKNLAEIAKFVSEKISLIDGVVSVATHFILKKYKIEGHNTFGDDKSERQIVL